MILVGNGMVMADVETILSDLQIELAVKGIPLLGKMKKTGRNVMVTCPNHSGGMESKPSCGVSLDKTYDSKGREVPPGTAHCFTCGYRASLPEFVSFCFGRTDPGVFGTKWLLERYSNILFEGKRQTGLEFKIGKTERVYNYVSEEELSRYRFIHPYMAQRGLTIPIIELFDIGYDPQTDCLTFPVTDKQGRVMFVQRRSVSTKFFKFGEEDPKGDTLYGIRQVYDIIDSISELWVVESPIDALSLWVNGQPAVAIMGALCTPLQLDLINEIPVRKIIVGLDNDDAGEKGTAKMRALLYKTKLLYRPIFPQGIKDVNQFMMTVCGDTHYLRIRELL